MFDWQVNNNRQNKFQIQLLNWFIKSKRSDFHKLKHFYICSRYIKLFFTDLNFGIITFFLFKSLIKLFSFHYKFFNSRIQRKCSSKFWIQAKYKTRTNWFSVQHKFFFLINLKYVSTITNSDFINFLLRYCSH